MGDVTVLVLHPPLLATAGPLTAALDAARRELAARHVAGFRAAGAAEVAMIEEGAEEPFGARLRRLAGSIATDGVIVLGSGAMVLARPADYRAFVVAAAADAPRALANNRYSADALAVSQAAILCDLPDLPSDNALPRWLDEVAGIEVADLRRRPRLALDLDSPADLALAGWPLPPAAAKSPLPQRLERIRSVMADRRAELTVTGRTSAGTLAALERGTACRVRAVVEERGLRASSRLAQAADGTWHGRPPCSLLGRLLDIEGPEALGRILSGLGEAAVIDSRVLLAHRLGVDEAAWPVAEDRFASDLLLPARIADPWLRALTASAADAPIPVLLGGHTLVGPGLRRLACTRPMTPAEAAIRDEIGRRGPIPFADFMALAAGPSRWRVLHRARGTPDARGRLPHRAGAAPHLRGHARAPGGRGMGARRTAGALHAPRVRGRRRDPRAGDPRRPPRRRIGPCGCPPATRRWS